MRNTDKAGLGLLIGGLLLLFSLMPVVIFTGGFLSMIDGVGDAVFVTAAIVVPFGLAYAVRRGQRERAARDQSSTSEIE